MGRRLLKLPMFVSNQTMG